MAKYTQLEMIENLKDYFAENVPVKITEAGLSLNIEDFLDYPPDQDDKRQFAVYLAEGEDSVSNNRDAFIVQVQLPGVIDVAKYHGAIWPLVRSYNPKCVGHTTKDATWQVWYPGEIGGGGSSSFIYYEMGFSSVLDDCFLDDTNFE